MTSRQLTQAEFDSLPAGAEVAVTWSGGNGPHKYRVHVDKWGTRYVYSERPAGVRPIYDRPNHVGDYPLDQVWVEE